MGTSSGSLQTVPHKSNKATPEKIGTPFLEDAVEIAMKSVQPGFSMEYTNLKVSGCSDQKTIQRTVEVSKIDCRHSDSDVVLCRSHNDLSVNHPSQRMGKTVRGKRGELVTTYSTV